MMKKKNIKTLKLNKKSISNLNDEQSNIKGGLINSISCFPNGICAITQNCPTDDGCGGGTDNCGTVGCNTNGCLTVSCPGVGICA